MNLFGFSNFIKKKYLIKINYLDDLVESDQPADPDFLLRKRFCSDIRDSRLAADCFDSFDGGGCCETAAAVVGRDKEVQLVVVVVVVVVEAEQTEVQEVDVVEVVLKVVVVVEAEVV